MKNPFKQILPTIFYLSALLHIVCSLPSDIKPVQWNMHLEIPVTNQHFTAQDLVNQHFGDGMELHCGSIDSPDDTVCFYRSDTLLIQTIHPLIIPDTSIIRESLGIRTLQNTPQIDFFFNFTDHNRNLPEETLIHSFPFSDKTTKPIHGIRSVTFDQSTPDLRLEITNKAKHVNLSDVTITLWDKGIEICRFDTSKILSESSFIVPIKINEKTIHDPVTVKATILSGSIIKPNDGLGISFNFDGLFISDAVILDSMIEYSDSFSGCFSLSDSIKLDILDLENVVLSNDIFNPCNFKLSVSCILENTLDYHYAIKHKINTIEQIKSVSDKSAFTGNLISDTLFRKAGEFKHKSQIHLNNIRFFPYWNPDSGNSFVYYQYKVCSLADGRWIHFRKDDQFILKMNQSKLPFIKVKGNVMYPIVDNFSSIKDIGFDWNKNIIDSLKKSFRFQKIGMQLVFTPKLPPNSSIDSLEFQFTMKDNSHYSDSVVLHKRISSIKPDSSYSNYLDISQLLNNWPDTLSFKTQVKLPAGTGMELYNQKDNHNHYSTSFSIDVKVDCILNIPLSWKVLDTIYTELDPSTFSIENQYLDWINKIRNPEITIHLNMINNTNVQFNLYGFYTSGDNKNLLMSIPDSLFYKQNFTIQHNNLFKLFGDEGLKIESRGVNSSKTVKLDEKTVHAFLYDKQCLIRWFLVIPSCNFDALTSNDFFELTAVSTIKGIGNSDTLFSEY